MTELPLSAINGKRLLSTEHLDHWQGSYKTMNFKEIRLFNNAESHFQAQVAQGFIRTF